MNKAEIKNRIAEIWAEAMSINISGTWTPEKHDKAVKQGELLKEILRLRMELLTLNN